VKRKLLLSACHISLIFILSAVNTFAEGVHEVYEYQGKDGVPEFTDQVKPDKSVKSVQQIKKTSPEQEQQSREKLQRLVEKDRQRDKQRTLEKQLEAERNRRYQTERELELERLRNADRTSTPPPGNDDKYDVYWYGRPPYRPGHPGLRPPIVRPPVARPPIQRPMAH